MPSGLRLGDTLTGGVHHVLGDRCRSGVQLQQHVQLASTGGGYEGGQLGAGERQVTGIGVFGVTQPDVGAGGGQLDAVAARPAEAGLAPSGCRSSVCLPVLRDDGGGLFWTECNLDQVLE